MNLQEVNVKAIENETGHELSDNCYRVCTFCDKIVKTNKYNSKSCEKLGGNKFFCPFCLRNNHHYRSGRNVLGFSYRGIIGYYYYKLYNSNPPKIYFSQLEQLIEKHQQIGLQNPILSYDPSVFMWYADFNKIGCAKYKAPFSEFKEISNLIFASFDIKTHINPYIEKFVLEKFQKSIDLFYEQRKRPKDRRMLIPTLSGTFRITENNEFFETTRNFTRNLLVLN